MSEILAKAKVHFEAKLPFVMYCKPSSDMIIGLLQKDTELYSLRNNMSGFAFVSFDNKKRYLIPDEVSDVYFEKISGSDLFVNKSESDVYGYGKEVFEKLVEKALLEIEKGTFEKVVLSRKEILLLTVIDFEMLFLKLIQLYPNALRYVFYHPEIGFWLGATPEQLMKIKEGKLQTVSLAGTQVINNEGNVVWGEKEIKEQQIVTDYIASCLRPFSNEIVQNEPMTFVAGNLVHIKTDISAQINIEEVENILSVLHPTPAVCGFPKMEALKFITDFEGYYRSFYAGFLGEWNKDFKTYKENQYDLFVNLRCMSIEKNELNIYVGCGITNGSIPEMEYIETVNKAMTMKRIV